MIRQFPNLRFSISHTSRPMRPGDQEGKDYYFVSAEEFQRMIDHGDFEEWAVIYGHHYGTSRKAFETMVTEGYDVILDIDDQGARQLREKKISAVYVFILPPSVAELERRLSRRKTEDPEVLRERLGKARAEIEEARMYDYVIVNNELPNALEKLKAVIRAESCRKERMMDVLKPFLQKPNERREIH